MSDTTRTLELPAVPAFVDGESNVPAPHLEPEPTTLTIPVVGVGEAIVVDEPTPGTRSAESLSLSPRRAGLALTALAVGAFATGANEAAVVALAPAIAGDLGVPVASVGLLATAFALTIVVASIPLTLAASRLSKRVALSATLGVWTAGVVIAATASGLGQLAAGRVVSAAAHGLFWGVVAPTAAALFAPHLRARTVTRIMVGAAAAGVVGTPLVTAAGSAVGWQAPLWVLAALGVALTASFALTLPGRPRREPDDADQPEPASSTGDLPSMPAYVRVLVVTFVSAVAMGTTWTYIVPFYTDVAGVPTSTVPILFALGGTVAVGATLAVSRFLVRSAVPTVAVGLGILAAAWSLLAIGAGWSAALAQTLQGAGWATLLAALLNWAMRHTPWRTEVGASVYMATLNGGAALGPVLGGIVVTQWGLRALPLVSLALTLAAAVVTARVDRTMLRRLRVPRHVRRALGARHDIAARRREWRRRTARRAYRPVAAAWAVGQQGAARAARGADSALRGHVADLDRHLR